VSESFTATGAIWIWSTDRAPAGWHFLTIDGDVAEAISSADLVDRLERSGTARKRGWGAIRVTAKLGTTSWKTSIFPSKEQGGFLLPVKASVRKAEGVSEGDLISVEIAL
jgi:hypothetical protein